MIFGDQFCAIISIDKQVKVIWHETIREQLAKGKNILLNLPKEIEIVGLDIAELGGMTQEMYAKLKQEFGTYFKQDKFSDSGKKT